MKRQQVTFLNVIPETEDVHEVTLVAHHRANGTVDIDRHIHSGSSKATDTWPEVGLSLEDAKRAWISHQSDRLDGKSVSLKFDAPLQLNKDEVFVWLGRSAGSASAHRDHAGCDSHTDHFNRCIGREHQSNHDRLTELFNSAYKEAFAHIRFCHGRQKIFR